MPGTTRRLLISTTVPETFSFLKPYAAHFRGLGWRVDAATGDGDIRSLRDTFQEVWRIPWSRQVGALDNWVRAPSALRRAVAQGNYDIVHTHTPIASFVTRAALRKRPSGRPAVVYTAHGFHFQGGGRAIDNARYIAAERLAGRWTDRLIVINEEDWKAARRFRIVQSGHLRKFPGIGIDLNHYCCTPALLDQAGALRRSLRLADTVRLLSMVAEMQPGKNHHTALRALALSDAEDLHLALVGAGPLRRNIEETADDLGILDRVHFLGHVHDVRPVVLASTATLLPSRREGLSRAVLESLALGVPVVGGRTRGIAELVDSDGGILVNPDDAEELARAYEDIALFPTAGHLRPQLESRLQSYSLDLVIAKHESLYRELLSTTGPD